jgi:hypothetical protein
MPHLRSLTGASNAPAPDRHRPAEIFPDFCRQQTPAVLAGRMSGVANLVITDDTLTVQMSRAEKAEALHRDLTMPRSAVTGVRVVADGLAEVHGLKMPGTGIPGVIMAGTWISRQGSTFAVCHGRGPAIVIELTGQHVDRIVMTVDNPEEAVTELS